MHQSFPSTRGCQLLIEGRSHGWAKWRYSLHAEEGRTWFMGKGEQLQRAKYFLSAWNRWLPVKDRLWCCFCNPENLQESRKEQLQKLFVLILLLRAVKRLSPWVTQIIPGVLFPYLKTISEGNYCPTILQLCSHRGWPCFQPENELPITFLFLVIYLFSLSLSSCLDGVSPHRSWT